MAPSFKVNGSKGITAWNFDGLLPDSWIKV
jgi:hypothetical protein